MNQIATRPETSINQIGIQAGAHGTSIAPQSLGEVVRFAEVMCKADIALPPHLRGNAGACMAVALQALEWQMSPFAVASKSYAVKGAIAYEAQLIAAVVNTRSGIKGRLKYAYSGEGDGLVCTVSGMLDGEVCEYETPHLGAITPKNSPLWKVDPRQQLGYFAARSWARRHCPEVILGVYDRDEAEQFRGSENAKDVTPSLAERLALAKIDQHEPAQTREGFDADFVRSETAALSGEAEIEQETSASPSAGEGSDGATPPNPQGSVAAPLSADEADNGEAGEQEAADGQSVAPVSPSNEAAMVNSAKPMNTDALKAEMVKKLLQLAGDNDLTEQERLETLEGMRQVWIDKIPGFPGVVSQAFATAAKIVKGELKPDAGRKFMEGLI